MSRMAAADELDQQDELKKYRDEFLIPRNPSGEKFIYLCGNSLGLQPRRTQDAIQQELIDWARLGVEGHFEAKNPWLPYHEFVAQPLARVVGAHSTEVVAMNSLTVNLHLLMVSFYRPTKERYKIVIEGNAFPSDQYAVASQAQYHAKTVGFDPSQAVLEIFPREGETHIRTEDFVEFLEKNKSTVAMVMIGGVNYLNGQLFDISTLCQKSQQIGATFGVDLAHAAGNVLLKLHDWNVDFAAWCSYKYLNSGPGGISGVFVHERHHKNKNLPKFAGWWGHDKKTRFAMPALFEPMESAESWQLSNPPIFQLAALRASLEIFDQATMGRLRDKSRRLTQFLWDQLQTLPPGFVDVFTPKDPEQRGSQLSLKINRGNRDMVASLRKDGVICDFREPNIIRVAPVALYNQFADCAGFVERLRKYAQ